MDNKYRHINKLGMLVARCPDSGVLVVPFAEIDRCFTAELQYCWKCWANGITYVAGGYYLDDVESFLNGRVGACR